MRAGNVDIAAGVRSLLADDGVFVFEVSYLVDIVDRLLFDTVYHEHLCYHSMKPLVRFLARHGMQLIAVQRLPTKGGSIRCIAQLSHGPRRIDSSVQELLALERTMQMDKLATFEQFTATINAAKAWANRYSSSSTTTSRNGACSVQVIICRCVHRSAWPKRTSAVWLSWLGLMRTTS